MLRDRTFVLDGGVPLSLGAGDIVVSASLAFRILRVRKVEGAFLRLLGSQKMAKAGGPCGADAVGDISEGEGGDCSDADGVLEVALIKGRAADVSGGKQEVGEENETSHGLGDDANRRSGSVVHWELLVVVSEVGELGVRIGEIDLEIPDVSEIFENLHKLFLAVLRFQPVLDLLRHLRLTLIPDSNIQGGGKESLGLGIGFIELLLGTVPSDVLGIPSVELGGVSGPFCGSGCAGRSSGLHRSGPGDCNGGAINDGKRVGEEEVHLHPGNENVDKYFPGEKGGSRVV